MSQYVVPEGMVRIRERCFEQALGCIPLNPRERKKIYREMRKRALIGLERDYYTVCSHILDIFKKLGKDKGLAVTCIQHLDFGHGLGEDPYKHIALLGTGCGSYLVQENPLSLGEKLAELIDFLRNPRPISSLQQVPSLLIKFSPMWKTLVSSRVAWLVLPFSSVSRILDFDILWSDSHMRRGIEKVFLYLEENAQLPEDMAQTIWATFKLGGRENYIEEFLNFCQQVELESTPDSNFDEELFKASVERFRKAAREICNTR